MLEELPIVHVSAENLPALVNNPSKSIIVFWGLFRSDVFCSS